jgi:glycosyltransferase involved in cell wall biosynthesis
MSMKVTVVLLTWKRVSILRKTLLSLANQTYQDFDVRISNGNPEFSGAVDRFAESFSNKLRITVSHDGNRLYAFRRFTIGRELAKNGTDVVLFIDDDVVFDSGYVELCLNNYQPKTYQSGFAWSFQDNGSDYYKYRTKVKDTETKVHYCGTGVSMIDSSIFLDDRLYDVPAEAYLVEDLWLSYFAQDVLDWKLKYIPMKNVSVGGSDPHALYKKIIRDKKLIGTPDKADFLRLLVSKYHWKL